MTSALVLEGGAYRGQFTAGVLDVLLEQKIYVDRVYGVSAGALCAFNYCSHQIGRSNRVNLAFRDDKRYMSMPARIKKGAIVPPDFLYDAVQNRIDPFDNEAYDSCGIENYAVVSNLQTGQAEYMRVATHEDIDIVRASASLPLFSEPVIINDIPYLDGGTTDSVPVEHSLSEGNDRIIVVLTQHRQFVKHQYSPSMLKSMSIAYHKYPNFFEAIQTRYKRYNQQRINIFRLENEGKILLIAPPEPVKVRSVNPDGYSLLTLYVKGRQEALKNIESIREYLTN